MRDVDRFEAGCSYFDHILRMRKLFRSHTDAPIRITLTDDVFECLNVFMHVRYRTNLFPDRELLGFKLDIVPNNPTAERHTVLEFT